MAMLSKHTGQDGSSMRLAIEGCGHGTLDAIYASVSKACQLKNWDGVDLLIICGDFQAVRDRLDLNVTAMPAKYRQMADFHHYYWGSKHAPYLTIFIGGNHEASNHLFELYYGGWVAPNIYYLGAANVIQVGPLKIAGLSGIWKGYDYRKPHYERLPYNEEDIQSIYHVRELDVRKLLAFRSQIDIGLSHDWPQGIEWLGDHARLFRHKQFLKDDAVSGKLGSVAANQVLDHLRPPYWFSAHLHTKYSALKTYEKPLENTKQVSAWNNFGATAKVREAAEDERLLQEQKERREEAQRSGIPFKAGYTYEETHKKLRLDDGFKRTVTSISNLKEPANGAGEPQGIPQLDGCCQSISSKRRRESSSSREPITDSTSFFQPPILQGQHSQVTVTASMATTAVTANPDAIDIDMSDDDSDSAVRTDLKLKSGEEDTFLPKMRENYEDDKVNDSNDQEAQVQNGLSFAMPEISTSEFGNKSIHSVQASMDMHDADRVHPPLPTLGISHQSSSSPKQLSKMKTIITSTSDDVNRHKHTLSVKDNNATESAEVPEDVRAQLAALSSKFADKPETSPALPHSKDITNKQTQFLALSKCEVGQHFLQLLEIERFQAEGVVHRPYRVKYVPEWLAILRVFAPELYIGQDVKRKPVPPHRGDTYYRERIVEEEEWIMENVIKKGLLDVPENFTITATPLHDDIEVDGIMPKEVTNPQTVEFCKLIDIENPFHEEDAVRQARELQGPPPPSERFGQYQRERGRSGGFHRGRGHHNNNRGGGRGRGGRGRGRGGRG